MYLKSSGLYFKQILQNAQVGAGSKSIPSMNVGECVFGLGSCG